MDGSRIARAMGSGAVGAVVLTVVHEAARRLLPGAPQVHVLGMRAVARGASAAGRRPPDRQGQYRWALVGDLLSNAAYYALVGMVGRHHPERTGAILGAGAGVGTALLPPPLGFGHQPGERFPMTHLLTVAWYTVGGVAAGAAYRSLSRGE